MKKYIILPLLSLSLIAISCEDEAKEVSECAAITADFTSSMNAFNTYLETGDGGGEDGKDLCDNYASSLQELIDEGCMSLSDLEMEQEEYDMIVNGTFCSLLSLID